MLALAVSWSVAAAVGLALVRPWILAAPSVGAAREILALAVPLAPAIVATWGADFFHRAYLIGVAGATEAGYLSMATRLGSIAMLVVAAAQLAWQPHAFRLGTSDEAARQLATEGRQIVVALVACVGLLGLLTPEALTLIGGSAYVAAGPAVGAFLVSVLAVGLFSLASLASVIQRRTADLGWAVVVGVGSAVIANLVLAPRVGAVGTGVAIAIGQSISALIAMLLGRRRMPIPFAWYRILALVGLTGGLIVAATVMFTLPMVLRLALIAGLGVALMAEGTLLTWLGSIGRGGRRPAGT
jgi:O-antigen/teichoic acid export membrane protein